MQMLGSNGSMGAYNFTDGVIFDVNSDGAPPPPAPPPVDIQMLQGIVRGLQLYYTPVLAIFGLLGNLVCLLTIGRQTKATSGHVYSTALILAESLQLLTLLHEWMTVMGIDLYRVIGWCHFAAFLIKGSQFLCQWYLVCLTVDCFLSYRSRTSNAPGSSTNVRRTGWSPTWRARVISIAVAVVALVVFFNISLTADLFYVGSHPVCTTAAEFESVMFYLGHIDVFLNVLVPCVLVVLCAVGLMRKEMQIRAQDSHVENRYWLYCIVHSLIWLPLQLITIINTITILASRTDHALRAFLWKQIVKHISLTNMAVNVVVLLACHPVLRKYVLGKLRRCSMLCSHGKQSSEHEIIGNVNGSARGTSIEVVSPSDDEAAAGDVAC